MYKFGKLSGAQLRKQKLIKLANQYNLSIYSEGTKNRNKMLSADGIYNKLKKFFRDNYNYKLNFDNIDSIDNESPYFEGLPTARLQNLARLSNMYKISLAIGPQGPQGPQGQPEHGALRALPAARCRPGRIGCARPPGPGRVMGHGVSGWCQCLRLGAPLCLCGREGPSPFRSGARSRTSGVGPRARPSTAGRGTRP